MTRAYLLPGMAADRRLYSRMEIGGIEPVYIDWPAPQQAKSLAEYAHEIVDAYVDPHVPHILIGSSMGGMVAVEMAHITQPIHTFLLSAPASRAEFPPLLNAVRLIGFYRWFSPQGLQRVNRLADTFMGFKEPEDRALFYAMLEGYGPEFLHFAVRAILEWEQFTPPIRYTQVLGSEDRLFKPKRAAKPPLVLKGGGHFTTFEQPQTLSEILTERILAL